ncbi:MAG: PLP-dependent aspartate aminotransferase family protein [Gemmatimonadota bacterium]
MPEEADGKQGFSTIAVHAGGGARHVGSPVSGEIHQSTTFVGDALGEAEVLYSRFGNNPTHRRLEDRLAALEGAESCLLTGSGMGAMAAALLSRLRAGDHLVASDSLYGGTSVFLDRELSRLGIETTYADLADGRWTDAIRPSTRVVLSELPSNPLLRVIDPAPLGEAARRAGAVLIVDATIATPVNCRPLEHGADLVVHSATKYLGGHSDVTAGVVCGPAELVNGVRERSQLFGTAPDPHASWLLERGIKTLGVRMERHNANGLAIARWLEEQPEVSRVHYPGVESHPDHRVASRLLRGFGGLIGCQLVGGTERVARFIDSLKLCTLAPSFGGVETLLSEPRLTSHVKLTPEQRAERGFPDGFLRFSFGIEDPADLIGDLRQAFDAAFQS